MRIAGAIVLGIVALAIAFYGLQINRWYGASLGKTAEASALLAAPDGRPGPDAGAGGGGEAPMIKQFARGGAGDG
jgi:hypothetical protein